MRVQALSVNPKELKILFPEDPCCYLARENNFNLTSLFAFDQSYLEYIKEVIDEAASQKKHVKLVLELVPVIKYNNTDHRHIYERKFIYVNHDINSIIYVDE